MISPERSGLDKVGQRVAYWQLYRQRKDGFKTIGVDTPNGKYYRFENGEYFEQVEIPEIPGEKVATIIQSDGTRRLFESWALDHEPALEETGP